MGLDHVTSRFPATGSGTLSQPVYGWDWERWWHELPSAHDTQQSLNNRNAFHSNTIDIIDIINSQ
eukprot:1918681-Rhodomonas_salina.1